jgi:hypothetical protein
MFSCFCWKGARAIASPCCVFEQIRKRWVLLGIYPKDCDTGYSRGTCTSMFIAALFTIAKLWKQPRCPSTDEWIKKMWYLYTMEFYAAMKKNEILSFATKWMELENIILSEVSQTQKTKNCMLSLFFGL